MWREVLGTPAGRHILYFVIQRGRLFADIPTDILEREAGRRDLALEVLSDIMAINPRLWPQMELESLAFEEQFSLIPDDEDTDQEEPDYD